MTRSPRSEENHQTSNVLGLSETTVWRELLQMLYTTLCLNKSSSHLRGKESRCNSISQDMTRPKLDSQVLRQMDSSRLGSRVRRRCVLADCANANTRHRGSDNDTGWICDGCLCCEEWGEPSPMLESRLILVPTRLVSNILLDRVEHTLDIQIHNLRKHLLGVGVKLLAPCCAGIGEENINMVCGLAYLGDKSV